MKIAAYQAPLRPPHASDALQLVRTQVERCEHEGVEILCCPEAVIGGLADQSESPHRSAIAAGDVEATLAPLASTSVTTIIGFTELAHGGRLYNAAAVVHGASLIGVYRKLYPAINRSVYEAGHEVPVFRVGALTFGVTICNDSNYFEPARLMAARGASVLFVPTNNALPTATAGAELVAQARNVDVARAVENSVWVIRADVAGQVDGLTSHGSSGIVNPDGMVVLSAKGLGEDLLVVEIDPRPPRHRRGWDASRNPAVMEQYETYVFASSGAVELPR